MLRERGRGTKTLKDVIECRYIPASAATCLIVLAERYGCWFGGGRSLYVYQRATGSRNRQIEYIFTSTPACSFPLACPSPGKSEELQFSMTACPGRKLWREELIHHGYILGSKGTWCSSGESHPFLSDLESLFWQCPGRVLERRKESHRCEN